MATANPLASSPKSPASPFAAPPQNPTNPLAKAPNFQTITGQNTYVAPYQPPKPVGVKATDPASNVSSTSQNLPTNQQSTYVPPAQTNNTSQQNQNSTYNPNAGYNAGVTPQQAPQGTPAAPAGSTPNTGLYGQLIGQLQNTATNGSPNVTAAIQAQRDLANSYGNETARIESLPVGVGDQTGREAILNRLYASKQAAAATGVSNALTANGQQINGLGTAAGLAGQTTQLPYGTPVYNQASGQYLSGGSGAGVQPTDPFYQTLQHYAQLRATGQEALIPGSISGNSVLNAQVTQMAQQSTGGGYNYNTAAGNAQANQSNAAVGGTAPVNANASIYSNSLSSYYTLQNSVQNVDQFGNLLTQSMGGINPFDVKYANQTLATIRGQLNSGDQAAYDNTLAALRSKVSGLLSAGGNEVPSAITADAQKILDGSLPLGGLQQVLGRIQQEGQILLNNQAQIVNQSRTGTLGGSGSNTSGASTGANPWH